MIAADTSVAVAAALPWHEAHRAARGALRSPTSALIAHVAVETFSVLTRLPSPRRVPASVAREYLQQAFVSPMLTLTPAGYQALLDRAAAEGITGGAIYDALVATTAAEAGATLVTLDVRAIVTYERLQVDYQLVPDAASA